MAARAKLATLKCGCIISLHLAIIVLWLHIIIMFLSIACPECQKSKLSGYIAGIVILVVVACCCCPCACYGVYTCCDKCTPKEPVPYQKIPGPSNERAGDSDHQEQPPPGGGQQA